ncbi:MAG TPA: ABC transporter substrate-binding protein, partial [Ilumatobacteraceae bacterium]
TALKTAGATSLGYFYYDIPTVQQATPAIEAIAKGLGIKIVPISISITNPDWTAAVATAMADGVGSMWGVLQEGDCTNMVRAARSAGFDGPIAVGSCSAYIAALGKQAVNTLAVWPYYFPQLADAAPASIQSQLKIYTAAMQAAGHGDVLDSYATASFATTMELSEILKTINGPVTGETLTAALQKAQVPGFMGPDVNCAGGVFPGQPTACNSKILLLKVVDSASGPVRQLLQSDYFDAAAPAG